MDAPGNVVFVVDVNSAALYECTHIAAVLHQQYALDAELITVSNGIMSTAIKCRPDVIVVERSVAPDQECALCATFTNDPVTRECPMLFFSFDGMNDPPLFNTEIEAIRVSVDDPSPLIELINTQLLLTRCQEKAPRGNH